MLNRPENGFADSGGPGSIPGTTGPPCLARSDLCDRREERKPFPQNVAPKQGSKMNK